MCFLFCFFFFFKQKTAYEMRISDWSSDVCSSDLQNACHIDGRADARGDISELDRGLGGIARCRQGGCDPGEASADHASADIRGETFTGAAQDRKSVV